MLFARWRLINIKAEKTGYPFRAVPSILNHKKANKHETTNKQYFPWFQKKATVTI